MITVTLDEIQHDFYAYIQRVQAGETLVITDADQPLAELKPITAQVQQRPWGLAKGQFTVPDDFDEPLPDDVLRDFSGL